MTQSALVCASSIALSAVPAPAAFAGSNYDGACSLVFITQRGECDPSYSFDVNIANGIVGHPNLARFTGRVSANGVVRASVTVHEKYAAGAGRLTKTAGQGTWKVVQELPVVPDIGQHRSPDEPVRRKPRGSNS